MTSKALSMRTTILFFEGQQPLFQGVESILDKKSHTLVFIEPRYPKALENLKALGWKVMALEGLSLEAVALRLKNRSLIIPFPDRRFQKSIAILKKSLTRKITKGIKSLINSYHSRFQKECEKRSELTLEASVEALRIDCKVLVDEDAYEGEELVMGGLCIAKPKSMFFPKAKPSCKKTQHLVFPYAQKIANKGSLRAQTTVNLESLEPIIEVSLPESVGRRAPISIKPSAKKKAIIRFFEEESKGKE